MEAKDTTSRMEKVSLQKAKSKTPYLGLTGTHLNIWITVACATAMTLFGA
jgi:hypothetical protein